MTPNAALSEYAYIYGTDRRLINLAPWLAGPAYSAPVRPTFFDYGPADPDALDKLRQEHPRARMTPPYRTCTLRLNRRSATGAPCPAVPMLIEIVVFLPDGYFVGFITGGQWADDIELDVLEAVPALERWSPYPTPMRP